MRQARAIVADRPADVLRPFALIGFTFFSTGFLGYLAVWNLLH